MYWEACDTSTALNIIVFTSYLLPLGVGMLIGRWFKS
jgi:hypothetical protein